MVRVKLTPRVRVILLLLAAYLVTMLGLIVYRFVAVVSGR
jgi:hypothetical protein